MKRDEKFDRDDRKADMSTRHCVNYQSAHEESAEETEKDNEQTWKKVCEEEKTCWQLSEESEREINDIIWELFSVQRQHIIISVKSLWEIWSKDLHQRERRSKENHDDNNEEHSEMNERNWHRQDIVNTQEHKNNEEIIETADISSQDKK